MCDSQGQILQSEPKKLWWHKLAMPWSSISRILAAPAFWGLSLLLFLVPLLSKATIQLGWDTKFLYIAAFLMAVATALHAMCRPAPLKYDSLAEINDSGATVDTLKRDFEKCVGKGELLPGSAADLLKAAEGTTKISAEVFKAVIDQLDSSKTRRRLVITIFMALVFALIVLANGIRAFDVFFRDNHPKFKPDIHAPNQLQLPTIMPAVLQTYLKTGTVVVIDHEPIPSSPSTTSTRGTVASPEDGGCVVVKDSVGKLIYIPKHRIYRITQV